MSRRDAVLAFSVVAVIAAVAVVAALWWAARGEEETTPSPTASPSRSPASSPGTARGDITAYGAVAGDGRDDTAAVRAALAANAAVFVPAGTFDVGSLTVPGGKTLTGSGWESWLRGDVSIGGARITLRDLKIGKAGNNFEQTARIDDFLAQGVRFTGGGGLEPDGETKAAESHLVWFNWSAGRDIRFIACHFERDDRGGNSVAFVDKGGRDGDSYENVILRDCYFERAGRMALEIIQRPPTNPATDERLANLKGYSITVTGCTFEGADSQVVSFDSNPTTGGPYNEVEFSFNTVGPGGLDPKAPYPHGIEVNNGNEAWVHDNTVAGSRGWMVNSDSADKGDARQIWEDNVFDQSKGLEPEGDGLGLVADNVIFRRNTVVFAGHAESKVFYITGRGVQLVRNEVTAAEGGGAIAYLDGATSVTFRDNSFTAPGIGVVLTAGSRLSSVGNFFTTGLADPFTIEDGSAVTRRDDVYR